MNECTSAQPAALRDSSVHFSVDEAAFPNTPHGFRITLRIISAQQLPKPQGKTKGEIIDPFVSVSVHGVPADCRTIRTATVDDNGINPLWDEMFDIPLRCPQLAHLLFNIKDGENALRADRHIGFCSVPAMTLREGYRMLPVYSNETAKQIEFASIFVHVAFSHERASLLTEQEIAMENKPFEEAAENERLEAEAAAGGGTLIDSPRSGNPRRKLQSEASVRIKSGFAAITRTTTSPASLAGCELASSDDDEGDLYDDSDQFPKTVRVWPLYAVGLSKQADGPKSLPDPFLKIFHSSAAGGDDIEMGKSSTMRNNANPVFEGVYYDVVLPPGLRAGEDFNVRLELWDYDFMSSNEFLGEVVLGADVLSRGVAAPVQHMLRPRVGRSSKYVEGSLCVALSATTVQSLSADKARSIFASTRKQGSWTDLGRADLESPGLLDSMVTVVGDGISSLATAMRETVFGEEPASAAQKQIITSLEHPERSHTPDPYGCAKPFGGLGLQPVQSFQAVQTVAASYVADIFKAAGTNVDTARSRSAVCRTHLDHATLPAPEFRLEPQECYRLHAPLMSDGSTIPEEVWLEFGPKGVKVVHRGGASTPAVLARAAGEGGADTVLALWPWHKLKKCVGNVQDEDPDVSHSRAPPPPQPSRGRFRAASSPSG